MFLRLQRYQKVNLQVEAVMRERCIIDFSNLHLQLLWLAFVVEVADKAEVRSSDPGGGGGG